MSPRDDIRPFDTACRHDACPDRAACATHWRGKTDYYTLYVYPRPMGKDRCGMWKPLDSEHGQQPSQG